MKLFRMARMPLVLLALLASLIVTSSAFAAAPVKMSKAPQKLFSTYMGAHAGDCPNSELSYSED